MADNGFKEKAKGAGNKIKGEAKDQWGSATNDSSKKTDGKLDKVKGEVQDSVGDSKNNNVNNK
ncbi:CsbD family protein [Oceanobacillus damuensis]|uniref:CsbD family protein n=1 Tax=Oceanobacillus damuensis TaxID=937928 RepID=UPI0008352DA8|nr:CsbD family protein [Oceanobacillus damuensis]